MSEIQLTFEQDGQLARLTINNTLRQNAISIAMWQDFSELLPQVKSARALLITGYGGNFCAGADINELKTLHGKAKKTAEFHSEMQAALTCIRTIKIPTIAHIDGNCYGAGMAIAMACDLRFADVNAKFSIPPAKLGLLYPQADLQQLVGLIGTAAAKQLLFTGEVITAETAAKINLINNTQLLDTTIKIIVNIINNSPRSITALKQMIDGRLDDPDAAFKQAFQSSDFTEGLAAFAQKRKPDFANK
ncbi:MAG: enoyl-CoA hydratase/isomerase family protein [Robiginitomaculum sp.]|nr:enoyl-CoA hydratase/isomerase family protein [Robiginitomaculum sp.]